MMRENDLETMYNELTEISKSEDFDLTGATRTVAIFRVAVECGATTVGFPSMAFLMSKMLTTALGIMSGDETQTFEDILDDFQEQEQTSH
tara:strand:+ start:628 stop:897 length:270 start_codon:yes stop_codon:yes gene_type:complete